MSGPRGDRKNEFLDKEADISEGRGSSSRKPPPHSPWTLHLYGRESSCVPGRVLAAATAVSNTRVTTLIVVPITSHIW